MSSEKIILKGEFTQFDLFNRNPSYHRTKEYFDELENEWNIQRIKKRNKKFNKLKMSNYIESVKKFHEVFNVPINNYKDEIDLKTRQLRIKLIFEELKELAVATDCMGTFNNLCLGNVESNDGNNRDHKEELDALCDLQYVLSGSVLSLGYQDVFDEAFDEVQSSNMSKICSNMYEVDETISDYAKKGVESYCVQKEEGYLVFRKDDDKVLKNSFYKEANIKKFI